MNIPCNFPVETFLFKYTKGSSFGLELKEALKVRCTTLSDFFLEDIFFTIYGTNGTNGINNF
jgi:hypothetical protein